MPRAPWCGVAIVAWGMALAAIACVAAAGMAPAAADWTGAGQAAHAQADDDPAPTGQGDAAAKLDGGLYAMVRAWPDGPPAPGTPEGRNVIVVVDRARGDAPDLGTAAREGKDTVVRLLGDLGATDIVAAQSLSFVTATVPIDRLGELAASKSVRRIGDGEGRLAPPALGPSTGLDLPPGSPGRAAWAATTLTGKGVSVAILDDGINSDVLNDRIAQRQNCAGLSGCRGQVLADRTAAGGAATHGTRVAGVIAAPPGEFRGTAFPSGIAPGVTLLDVITHSAAGGSMAAIAHGLDWALANGAHVAVVAAGAPGCAAGDAAPLVVDEAVEMGMVVVGAAGDGGDAGDGARAYGSVHSPHCSRNAIAVGATGERGGAPVVHAASGRGPATGPAGALLKPDIAAPGEGIAVLKGGSTHEALYAQGTGLAAAQAAGAAALVLEARPSISPEGARAALLLGARWQGVGACTASMYERAEAPGHCSHATMPADAAESGAGVDILNNVGFGILGTGSSARCAEGPGHVIGGRLASATDSRLYEMVADATEPTKVILAWPSGAGGTADLSLAVGLSHASGHGGQSCLPRPAGPHPEERRGEPTARHESDSAGQAVEFVAFTPILPGKSPWRATYHVTVSAASMGGAPGQDFALAGSHRLSPIERNTAPAAAPESVIVDPFGPTAVRLRASDAEGDGVSFAVGAAARGTVGTPERITAGASRAVYTPQAPLGHGDAFTARPTDGKAPGAAQTVLLVPDSPPAGSTRPQAAHSEMTDWREMTVRPGPLDAPLAFAPDIPAVPLRRVLAEAMDADGALLSFGIGGARHTAAVPWQGARQLELPSPSVLTGARIDADGHTSAWLPALMAVGFSAHERESLCPVPGEASPVPRTLRHTHAVGLRIPDGDGYLEAAIDVRHAGAAASVSAHAVVSHERGGDLEVALVSPDGLRVALGAAGDGAEAALYSVEGAPGLAGAQVAGEWLLEVADSRRGFAGTLDSWTLEADYAAPCPAEPAPPRPLPRVLTPVHDGFEGGLGGWVASGGHGWRVSTPAEHGVPAPPGRAVSGPVLHADACRQECHVTTRGEIDLSSAMEATLTMSRFVDAGLDAGERLDVLASGDGGRTWDRLARWTATPQQGGQWASVERDLSEYLGSGSFRLRLSTAQSLSSEDVQVDDVVVRVAECPGRHGWAALPCGAAGG